MQNLLKSACFIIHDQKTGIQIFFGYFSIETDGDAFDAAAAVDDVEMAASCTSY